MRKVLSGLKGGQVKIARQNILQIVRNLILFFSFSAGLEPRQVTFT